MITATPRCDDGIVMGRPQQEATRDELERRAQADLHTVYILPRFGRDGLAFYNCDAKRESSLVFAVGSDYSDCAVSFVWDPRFRLVENNIIPRQTGMVVSMKFAFLLWLAAALGIVCVAATQGLWPAVIVTAQLGAAGVLLRSLGTPDGRRFGRW